MEIHVYQDALLVNMADDITVVKGAVIPPPTGVLNNHTQWEAVLYNSDTG